jgi:hypothetical protein
MPPEHQSSLVRALMQPIDRKKSFTTDESMLQFRLYSPPISPTDEPPVSGDPQETATHRKLTGQRTVTDDRQAVLESGNETVTIICCGATTEIPLTRRRLS